MNSYHKDKRTSMNQKMQDIYNQCENRMTGRINYEGRDNLVYHYTSAEGFYNIVTNKKLFFTDVAFLNDSTETVNIIATFRRALEELKGSVSPKYYDRLSGLMKLGDFETMVFGGEDVAEFDRYFVLACSCEQDSLNMWNYYTKGEESEGGYNIAFHREELVSSFFSMNTSNYVNELQLFYGYIIYDEQEKKALICEYLEGLQAAWMEAETKAEEETLLLSMKAAIKRLSVFFKHECFATEKEYRIIAALPYHRLTDYLEQRQPSNERLYKTRFMNNMFTPYIKLCFQPEGIKGVMMSPLCENYTTEYRFRSDAAQIDYERASRDVLQYGVHEFLRVNGYQLKANQIRRSEIPLRY